MAENQNLPKFIIQKKISKIYCIYFFPLLLLFSIAIFRICLPCNGIITTMFVGVLVIRLVGVM